MATITQEQAALLHDATQGILDERQFSTLQPDIDEVAANETNEWEAAKIRSVPVVGAFSHAMASYALAMAGTEATEVAVAPDNNESGLQACARYMELTTGVDKVAAKTLLENLPRTSQTFLDALDYLRAQRETIVAFKRDNPAAIQKKGKQVTDSPVEVEAWLALPIAGNAREVTPSVIIGEVMRSCLREGRLLASGEVAEELRSNLARLEGLTRLPGAVLNNELGGKQAAQENYRQLKENNQSGPSPLRWTKILEEYLVSGEVSPMIYTLGGELQHGFPENERVTAPSRRGLCAAQFVLRPYEPDTEAQNRRRATAYFQRYGFVLEEGAFSLGGYQLLRGIEVAEKTLFANKAIRSALERMADEIRVHQGLSPDT